jgi:thiol-disulfide isomerase/thioredoxin
MPDVAFERPDGSPAQLPDFKGTPLLLNLWATWCAPCVAELPTLDRAAATPGIAVLAVSQDTQPDKVAPFLAERGLKRLAPYRDPKLGLSLAFAANLPTTIFFGADGRERWRFTGGMDWTGAQAKALLAQR